MKQNGSSSTIPRCSTPLYIAMIVSFLFSSNDLKISQRSMYIFKTSTRTFDWNEQLMMQLNFYLCDTIGMLLLQCECVCQKSSYEFLPLLLCMWCTKTNVEIFFADQSVYENVVGTGNSLLLHRTSWQWNLESFWRTELVANRVAQNFFNFLGLGMLIEEKILFVMTCDMMHGKLATCGSVALKSHWHWS